MVTTTWTAASGDWNDPANWSNGVPTSTDTAVFSGSSADTISGNGAVATLEVLPTGASHPILTGTHAVGTFLVSGGSVEIYNTSNISFESALFTNAGTSDFAVVQFDAAATVGNGPITLGSAELIAFTGVLPNLITLSGSNVFQGQETFSGTLTGGGSLIIGDQSFNTTSDIAITGSIEGNFSNVLVSNATLSLSAGIGGFGTLTTEGNVTIGAATQNLTLFGEFYSLTFNNGTGHALIIGGINAYKPQQLETLFFYDKFALDGGSGSLTVFGNDAGGTVFGGKAGGNIIVAGAQAADYGANPLNDTFIYPPTAVTIGGGGNGDLLVATGRLNNVVAAATGSETITASGATGNNTLYGGTGADLIVAGGGSDTVIGGSGPETIFAGTGSTAILAGTGQDFIVGGLASSIIQVGGGNAVLFAGAGKDLIDVVSGQSGGGLLVSGFKAGTDQITSQGYASAPVVSSGGGNTIICFSDHTQITLLGVVTLPTSTIV